MKIIIAAALALLATSAYAQTCPPGTVTCNQSTETMGNTSQTASADNDQSQTTQAGLHTNSLSNASGVTISPQVQQSGNAVTQSGNAVQGGNATGGSATGNQSSNNSSTGAITNSNQSSATATGSTSNSGGNTLQGSTAATGASTSSALGGAAGAGGAGGSASQGQRQTADNTLQGGVQHQDARTTSGSTVDASDHAVTNSRSNFTVLPEQPGVPMSFSPSAQDARSTAAISVPRPRPILRCDGKAIHLLRESAADSPIFFPTIFPIFC